MKRNQLFHVQDLVFPLSILLPGTILCFWAAIAAAKVNLTAGFFISLATGIFHIGAIIAFYIVRYRSIRADFSTYHQIKVRLSTFNKLNVHEVERVTEELIEFWVNQDLPHRDKNKKLEKERLTRGDILLAIANVLCILVDQKKISYGLKFVRGYATGDKFFITYDDLRSIRISLFKHELSHCILMNSGWKGFDHHALFKDLNTGF